MNELWYYEHEGQPRGPVGFAAIEQLAASGEIGPATLVWCEGMDDWMPLESVAAATAPVPPPLPPPIAARPPMMAAPPAFVPQIQTRVAPHEPRGAFWPLLVAAVVGMLLAAVAVGWFSRGIGNPAQVDSGGDEGVVAAAPVRSAPPKAEPLETNPTDDFPPAAPPAPPAVSSPPAVPTVDTPPAPPAASPPMPGAPEPSNPPKPQQEQTLYQTIDVQRSPKFSVLGTAMAQDLAYTLVSQLRVGLPDESGVLPVSQVVLETKLEKSDDLSRSMFEQSLRNLKGWQFHYKLSPRREVIQWKSGPPDGKRAEVVEPKGAQGFLVTSVMDEDGWKELAQLSFFLPNPAAKPDDSNAKTWTRQMRHDFKPLGSWYGETRFVDKGIEEGVQRIDFTHEMMYQKAGLNTGGELPFKIIDAEFQAAVAGGSIEFDVQAGRIRRAQDNFRVTGQIAAEVLGQSAPVEVEELQTIVVRLSDTQ